MVKKKKKRKFSAAQLRAQRKFAAMARKRAKKARKSPRRAKRKITTTRKVRRMPRKKKRKATRKRGMSVFKILLSAVSYGAVRESISQTIRPFTAQIPILNASDEIAMFVLATLVKKRVRNKTVQEIATAAQYIEGARLGAGLFSGGLFGSQASGSGQLF